MTRVSSEPGREAFRFPSEDRGERSRVFHTAAGRSTAAASDSSSTTIHQREAGALDQMKLAIAKLPLAKNGFDFDVKRGSLGATGAAVRVRESAAGVGAKRGRSPTGVPLAAEVVPIKS